MQPSKYLKPSSQLNLFHVRPNIPPWESLPLETRHLAMRLLARLLRQHYRRSRGARRGQEVCDE